MKLQMKKTYICPQTYQIDYRIPVMDFPGSIPQGNGDDPIVDDEDDILSKGRKENGEGNWGNLW